MSICLAGLLVGTDTPRKTPTSTCPVEVDVEVQVDSDVGSDLGVDVVDVARLAEACGRLEALKGCWEPLGSVTGSKTVSDTGAETRVDIDEDTVADEI